MKIDRRSFLRLILASAAASTLDVEKLLWVPKPMIVVPEMPTFGRHNIEQLVAAAWEKYVGEMPDDQLVDFWLSDSLAPDFAALTIGDNDE